MADLELRSVTVTVAQERIQIRTDLPDAELGEIIAFIDERFKRYEKYQMDYKKRLSLLAVELTSELFEVRKNMRRAKLYCEQMDKHARDLGSLLEEGIDRPEPQI
ncbi:MAG: cell division protein ZapA [Fibrobacter sp.]|nr:cell division protein ZapA [Fibrobacter sp.]